MTHTMTHSFWQHAGRGPDRDCDIAIVGAGVVGCATAFWISRLDPSASIAVVDAGAVAGGASGRNAGFLLQGVLSDYAKDRAAFGDDRARRLWRFMRENRDLIFRELDGARFDLESSGSFIVAGSEEEDARLRSCVSAMRYDGAPAVYFAPDETNRRLSSKGFLGSLYVPSGAMLNPVLLVRHLLDCSGAEVVEHAPVRTVEDGPRGVDIDTAVGLVRAERAVLAVNAWLPRIIESLGSYVRPVRAQMLEMRPGGRRRLEVPISSHEGFFFARQSTTGALLVGGARHLHAREEVGYADEVTKGVQCDIERYVRTHFPELATRSVERRWSGVMGFSPDHVPVIGTVPGVPAGIWAAGFSGHGMGYGFRIGKLLAQMALGTADPSGLDLFRVDRFSNEARAQPASAAG